MNDLTHQRIVRKLNRKSFIRRMEQRITNAYELLMNTWYYKRLGCRLRTAFRLARNTIK